MLSIVVVTFCSFLTHFSLCGCLLDYVLELCPGGELLKYIRQTGSFSMPVAQFYTAEIVNALEHLHKKGFVHRDLKPENVLLSSTLHVKLVSYQLSSSPL